jgi:FxsC-like protein
MTNWFFLSHSRFDRESNKNKFINRFYDDLLTQIRLRRGKESSAFIDAGEVRAGDFWRERLESNLSTCRVLVCMYSRNFFNSPFCGKEFQIFYNRLLGYASGGEFPPLILPVMYTPPEDFILPGIVTDIQYSFDEFPDDYKENGLYYLMARKAKRDDYLDFLDIFADRLIKVAEEHVLSEWKGAINIEKISSAWDTKATQPNKPLAVSVSDPEDTVEYADFVFAAARRNEIEQLSEFPAIERYGYRGGIDWIPFHPDLPQPIGQFTQMVASREGFYYQALQLNTDLIEQIKTARRGNRVVIIIVDTWTLALENYCRILGEYDEFDPLNCSMIIVWNNKDEFTEARRRYLEIYIRQTFPTKSMRGTNLVFVNGIGCQKDLDEFLSRALHELRAQILRVNSEFRTLGAGEQIPILGAK